MLSYQTSASSNISDGPGYHACSATASTKPPAIFLTELDQVIQAFTFDSAPLGTGRLCKNAASCYVDVISILFISNITPQLPVR